MRELEIKRRLVQELIQHGEVTVIAHEYSFNFGRCRADLVCVIGGELYGYEIKSAFDKTARLEAQMSSYSKLFDYVSVVCDKKHLSSVRSVIPAKTGLMVCDMDGIKTKRKSKKMLRLDELVVLDAMPMYFLKRRFKVSASSKYELCDLIKRQFPKETIRSALIGYLTERFGFQTKLLLSETDGVVTLDDFYVLDLDRANLS